MQEKSHRSVTPADDTVATPFLSLRGEQLWRFVRHSMEEGMFRNYQPSRFAVPNDVASLREANEGEGDGRFVAPRVAAPPSFVVGELLPLPRGVSASDAMTRYLEAAGAKIASESDAALLRRFATASVLHRDANHEAVLVHRNALQRLLMDDDVLRVLSCSFWLTVLSEFQSEDTLDPQYFEALFLSLSFSFTRFVNRHPRSVAIDAVIAMDVVCSIAGATILAFSMAFPYFLQQMTDASLAMKVERRLLSWLLGLDCLKRERLGPYRRDSDPTSYASVDNRNAKASKEISNDTDSHGKLSGQSLAVHRNDRLLQRLADLETVATTTSGVGTLESTATFRSTTLRSVADSKLPATNTQSADASPSRSGLLSRSAALRSKSTPADEEQNSQKKGATVSRATADEIHHAVQLTERAAWEMRDRTEEIRNANRATAKLELEAAKSRELREMIVPEQWIPPFRYSVRAFHLDAVSPVVKSLLTALSAQSRALLEDSTSEVSALQRCAHSSIRQASLATTFQRSSAPNSIVGHHSFLKGNAADIFGPALAKTRWVYQRRSSTIVEGRAEVLRNGTVSRWKELVTELLNARPSLGPEESLFNALVRPVVLQTSSQTQAELSAAIHTAAHTLATAQDGESFDAPSDNAHDGTSVRAYSRPQSALSRRPPTPQRRPDAAQTDLGAFMTCVSTDPRTPYSASAVLARPSSALSTRSVVQSNAVGRMRPGSAASLCSTRVSTRPPSVISQRPSSAGGRSAASLSISERKRGIQIRWTGDQPNADAAHQRFRKDTAEKLRGSLLRIQQLNADETSALEQRTAANVALAVANGRTLLERNREIKTGLHRLHQDQKVTEQSAMETVIHAMEATTAKVHNVLKELDALKEALYQIDRHFLVLPESFRQQTLRFTAAAKAKASSIIREFKITNRDKSLWPRGLDHLRCPRARETELLGDALHRSPSPTTSPKKLRRVVSSFGEELQRQQTEDSLPSEEEDSDGEGDDAKDADVIHEIMSMRSETSRPVKQVTLLRARGSSATSSHVEATIQRSATAELYSRYAGDCSDVGSKATTVRMNYLQKQQAPPEMFRHRLTLS